MFNYFLSYSLIKPIILKNYDSSNYIPVKIIQILHIETIKRSSSDKLRANRIILIVKYVYQFLI